MTKTIILPFSFRFTTVLTCTTLLVLCESLSAVAALQPQQGKQLSNKVYETILSGRIAVVHDFLSQDEVSGLRNDAQDLYANDKFSRPSDYGTTSKVDPAKDRAVFRVSQWKLRDNGRYDLRRQLGDRMADVRSELAANLGRPGLDRGKSLEYGYGSTEISYSRFGPGAFLKKHLDEHSEELKGRDGWAKPTRRSVSWLVYLNDSWKTADGGQLRCYERKVSPALGGVPVGSRPNGDLQVGWIKGQREELPVFLDAKRRDVQDDCAMYIVDPITQRVEYITDNFDPHPILYVAGGEELVKRILIKRRDLAADFQLIEPPQSGFSQLSDGGGTIIHHDDTLVADIEPTAGTLVLFDAVSLPHEVLSTKTRTRWAISGWYHEDQQPAV